MFYYFIVYLSSGWPVSNRKPLFYLYLYLFFYNIRHLFTELFCCDHAYGKRYGLRSKF